MFTPNDGFNVNVTQEYRKLNGFASNAVSWHTISTQLHNTAKPERQSTEFLDSAQTLRLDKTTTGNDFTEYKKNKAIKTAVDVQNVFF